MKIEKNTGYEITKSVLFDDDRGFVLGHNPKAPAPYVTWQFAQTQGKRDYFWGHYHGDGAKAEGDFKGRVKDYADRYGCHVVETKNVELYQYYSTQRPVALSTFPKSINNPPLGFTNYDKRSPVEDGSFLAWGSLLYLHPLKEKEISDYELRPAPDNPDIRREAAVKRPIAEQLKDAAKLAGENRGQSAPKKDAPDKGDR